MQLSDYRSNLGQDVIGLKTLAMLLDDFREKLLVEAQSLENGR